MAEQRSANLPLCRQRLEHIIYAVGVYVNKNLFLTKAGTSDRISTKNEEQGCVTFMKRRFMKSPSFAKQNSLTWTAAFLRLRCTVRENSVTLRGAKSLNPMNLRRIIPTEEASHFPKLIVIFWELLRRFGNFSGRRFSFFKNNLFEKGKC